jgi:hypothetical protein
MSRVVAIPLATVLTCFAALHFQAIFSPAYLVISDHIENPEVLLDDTTPQGQAFAILLSEGLTDPFLILQRFVLMVLFFSTKGSNWTETGTQVYAVTKDGTADKSWNSFSLGECNWYGVECKMESNGDNAVTSIRLGMSHLCAVCGNSDSQ